jgi:hypothetical protein
LSHRCTDVTHAKKILPLAEGAYHFLIGLSAGDKNRQKPAGSWQVPACRAAGVTLRNYWQKKAKICAFNKSFHGHTF